MKTATAVKPDPWAGWKVPQHLIEPPVDPNVLAAAERAHQLAVSPEGGLHPVILNGYHTDLGFPARRRFELSGIDLVQRERTEFADRLGVLTDVWASERREDGAFNVFGSLLAGSLGRQLVPLYGTVFFANPPGPDGVTRKLPRAIKEEIRTRFWVATQILDQKRPRGISEQAFDNTWLAVRDLVNAHHKEHKTLITP